MLGDCPNSVGSSCCGGALGWTPVLLPWGQPLLPSAFALGCRCGSFHCARCPQGSWCWGPVSGLTGIPPKVGGLRISSPPSAWQQLRCSCSSHGGPHTPLGCWVPLPPRASVPLALGSASPLTWGAGYSRPATLPRPGSAPACAGKPELSAARQDGVQAEDESEERPRLHLLSLSFMSPSCQHLYLQIMFSLTNGCTSPASR